jgi:hypothetical protein
VTLAEALPVAGTGMPRSGVPRAILLAFVPAFATLLFVSLPQLADPLIRHDDFPAFFGDEFLYWEKTLSEGRWLNYLWMKYGPTWPAPVGFAFYQGSWALFAAAAAANALGPGARPVQLALLSTFIALSPHNFLISGWFNTQLPSTIFPAVFAVLAALSSQKAGRWLFLATGAVSMLTYPTVPLLMLALLLTKHDARRSCGDLAVLLVILVVSILAGMLTMYAINWQVHGVFGLVIDDWRNATPATDLESLVGNLPMVPDLLGRLYYAMGFGHPVLSLVNLVLLLAAMAVLAVRRPGEAVYIAVGMAAAFGLMATHSVLSGVPLPERSLVVLWLLQGIAMMRAALQAGTPGRRQAAVVGMLLLLALYGGQILKNTRNYTEWQDQTRALAALLPEARDRIVLYGDFRSVPGADRAGVFDSLALLFRLRQLTGQAWVFDCTDPPEPCPFVPPFDPAADPGPAYLIEEVDGTVYLRLPETIQPVPGS